MSATASNAASTSSTNGLSAGASNLPSTELASSATVANESSFSGAATGASNSAAFGAIQRTSPAVCRYYLRGICRFGSMCRFSHDLTGGDVISANIAGASVNETKTQPKPSTSRNLNWVNAPVFVPGRKSIAATVAANELNTEFPDPNMDDAAAGVSACASTNTFRTWADIVGVNIPGLSEDSNDASIVEVGSVNMLCPFESPCPYGIYCAYIIHLQQCKMCDQFCLHPNDQVQRRKHNRECLEQHERAMELSFAIARSKDKTCGICFDTIMEKAGREKRFGILPNCCHIFCLECIRKWRQAKQFEHKITRSCPECRVASDFVCPSTFWVETKEEKDKLLKDYRAALGAKDCKYFKKGAGKCPFGNKCFYKHALPNGELVDVGLPKRTRKVLRNTSEFIDLLDIYLWEFVDQRDYHWLDMISSTSEDDDTDWSDDDN